MDLSSIVAIDQHAYFLLTQSNAESIPLSAAFMRRVSSQMIQQPSWPTLGYLRSRREIADFLGCDPTEDAIQACRNTMGLESLAQRSFDAANLGAIFLDDGLFPDSSLPLNWHQDRIPSYRLIHIEALAERLMAAVDRFDVFLEWFRSEIDCSAPDVIGFTSTAAQRSGLAIRWVYPDVAQACFDEVKQRSNSQEQPIRLMEKDLVDFLLFEALNVAIAQGVPLQFDLGVGHLSAESVPSSPLQLRPLFEEPTYQSVPMVLRGEPSRLSQDAAVLASMYPQVYVDMGGIMHLSVGGMRRRMQAVIEQVPLNKILYSSGARFFPELVYLGAKWGRKVLGEALEDAVTDGDLRASEAEDGAISILHGTAHQLYRCRQLGSDTPYS